VHLDVYNVLQRARREVRLRDYLCRQYGARSAPRGGHDGRWLFGVHLQTRPVLVLGAIPDVPTQHAGTEDDVEGRAALIARLAPHLLELGMRVV